MEQKNIGLSVIAGANLKRLIKESEYRTQAEFAFAFGTDERSVGRWVNGGINRLDTIEELALFFKVDVLTFLSLR